MMNTHIVPYDGWSSLPEPREPEDRRIGSCIESVSSLSKVSEGDIVLLGIPQDIGVQRNGGRSGTAMAPFSVRESLAGLSIHGLGPNCSTILDIGNIMCEGRTLEDIRSDQEDILHSLLDLGARVIVIGGGHDIAFPSCKAMRETYSKIGIINIDPHLDVRKKVEGMSHSGSPFREMMETAKADQFIEFGTQSFAASTHHREFVEHEGGRIIPYEHIRLAGDPANQLSELMKGMRATDNEVYVSFDMDAVCSAFAPGVSAPATIGFTSDEIVRMAYSAGENGARIIDVVEINPTLDIDKRTSRLGALMIASCISGWSNQS